MCSGANRRNCDQPTPKYLKNRERHRIWATSFSNLEGTSSPNFFTAGDALTPSPAFDAHALDVLVNLHNIELLLNDEFKADVHDLFCRSANRSARTTRRGSEFCSCAETVLTIDHSQLKKGVGTTISKYMQTN